MKKAKSRKSRELPHSSYGTRSLKQKLTDSLGTMGKSGSMNELPLGLNTTHAYPKRIWISINAYSIILNHTLK
jgi:hypothetical protein